MNELHLFAGAGGGILGGLLLGHTCVCAVEIEPYCRNVLLQRQRDGILPEFPIWDDVRTFDGKPWRGLVDVVCGGFPCQDISCAGKGAGIDGARSGLWKEFTRIIGEVRPRYAFVENSPMLAIRGLARVLGELSEMGYNAEWCVLGADDVGAPHKRERIWILAYADGEWKLQPQGLKSDIRGWFDDCGCEGPENLVDTRSNGRDALELQVGKFQISGPLPRKLDRTSKSRNESWWRVDPADADGAFESQLGRVANGVADRVDRLKAIGNGQVPLVAASAFELLMKQVETEK